MLHQANLTPVVAAARGSETKPDERVQSPPRTVRRSASPFGTTQLRLRPPSEVRPQEPQREGRPAPKTNTASEMALEYRNLSGSPGSPVDATAHGAQQGDPIPVLSTDDTLPPTPIEDFVAAAGLHVWALAADTAVREGVRRACGERYHLTIVDDWGSL